MQYKSNKYKPAIELIDGYTKETLVHDQCNTRSMVTLLTNQQYGCPFANAHFPF